jgi:hypothetical protein
MIREISSQGLARQPRDADSSDRVLGGRAEWPKPLGQARYRLPPVYGDPEFVKAGGLMSYAPDVVEPYRGGRFSSPASSRSPSTLPDSDIITLRHVTYLKGEPMLG